MDAGIGFILYLAFGSLAVLAFLLLCTRISAYLEDKGPSCVCANDKMRKKFLNQIHYPDDSTRPGPPSEENITDDILCQPYIYGDTYSTGLSGPSQLATLPLTLVCGKGGNPGDALVTNGVDIRVLTAGGITFPQPVSSPKSHDTTTENNEPAN